MTENNGREAAKDNDLFFTCSLIDYIARKTQNIERVSDDFIREAGIRNGEFDNVKECNYAIPSHWDIGKVYKRLIKAVAEHEKIGIIEALFKVYNSFLSTKIDDYNSSMYYENPAYLLECYLESRVI